MQDNHDDELEEFCQSANHLHDINKNKTNNEVVNSEHERNGNVVSDLIDLELAKNINESKCDKGLSKPSVNSVVVENLNLKIIE